VLSDLATIKSSTSNFKFCFDFIYTDANTNNGLDANDKVKVLLGITPI
jgi:hypothetical protein